MNERLEPRAVEPHRVLLWFRLALDMMTRRIALVLLVSATVYVVLYTLGEISTALAPGLLGAALVLPAGVALCAQVYARDWWGPGAPRPWALCAPPLLRLGAVLLALHAAMAALQWLDAGGLERLHESAHPMVALLLPDSAKDMALMGPLSAYALRLVGEPFAIAMLATLFGIADCLFAPLLLRFAHAPAEFVPDVTRRALRLNLTSLAPVLLLFFVCARGIERVPSVAGLFVCFFAAVAAAAFRDIFMHRDALEPVAETPAEIEERRA